jgi:glycosyltransferase involved in cell wall biosynthesis
MRVAIAPGVWFNPRGTQVRFHAENLFGGNTVVLAQDAGREAPPDDRPFLIWAERRARPGQVLRSLIEHRTTRVPYGAARARILQFLRDQRVEAILAEFGNLALRLAPVANAAGVPIFAYFRGADASTHLREPLRVAGYRRMMPRLAGVFAVSRFLLDNLDRRGIRHPHSHVVPSGVNTDLFLPGPKRPQSFVAVGRFIPKKRPDITIRAFLSATRDHPAARLDMIGGGELLETCRALVAAAGAADRVRLLGERPHAEVRALLSGAEVFLQHSVTGRDGDTEGLPTSIQEAMACGTVVVSTRHAGIPDAVDEGRTGFMVAEGDEAGFADRIGRLLADRTALEPMAAAAREAAVARFDNRRLVRVVEDRMLALSGRPPRA